MLPEFLLTSDSVKNVYSYGSHVYGTATEKSDYDFIVIVDSNEAVNKLSTEPKVKDVDLTYYTVSEFQDLIDRHEISALECLFVPEKFVHKKMVDFTFNLNLGALRDSCSQKSSNSWVKAKKKFVVEKDFAPYIGQKSAWHSLRILDFACQIAKDGKISNYGETNGLLPVLLGLDSWEKIDENFRAINRHKNTEFKKLAPKNGANDDNDDNEAVTSRGIKI